MGILHKEEERNKILRNLCFTVANLRLAPMGELRVRKPQMMRSIVWVSRVAVRGHICSGFLNELIKYEQVLKFSQKPLTLGEVDCRKARRRGLI